MVILDSSLRWNDVRSKFRAFYDSSNRSVAIFLCATALFMERLDIDNWIKKNR
jgi:hypothetical protein